MAYSNREGIAMIPMQAIIPGTIIDVATWPEDDEFAAYPEGARPKTAHFPPADSLPAFINRQRRYLFKRSMRRYPDQFWAEVAAYQIGCLLGVEVPPALPAVNSGKNQCGALIEWFYEDQVASYVPGGSYMQQAIAGFDRKHGWDHNFHTIRVIFRALNLVGRVDSEWSDAWVKVLLFDALCGNTDRHQDNWGLLYETSSVGRTSARLSPAFDNGTSLGHELSEAHQGGWGAYELRRYIGKGCHHLKWKIGDSARLGHIDGVRKIADLAPEKGTIMLLLLAAFDARALRENLERLSELPMPVPLSKWRINLICNLVQMRRDLLIEVLQ